MSEIFIGQEKIDSIFELLGEKENDISFSVGWALAKAHGFLEVFLESVIGREKWIKIKSNKNYSPDNIKITLQKYEENHGFTDFEIEYVGYFYLIIEAKRGWNFPLETQLRRYVDKPSFKNSNAKIKKLIVLFEASAVYANAHFNVKSVDGIGVVTISWRDIYNCSREAMRKCSHAEKRLLEELNKYLKNIMTMQKKDSNWVYVAALNNEPPVPGAKITNIDIVKKKLKYWHPIGHRFPKEPPNYIAFRYNGKLLSIHRIKKYEVFTDPHKIIDEVPSVKWQPSFVYDLEKVFEPTSVVRRGNIYGAKPVWVMIDTLLTSKTIKEALDKTNMRGVPRN